MKVAPSGKKPMKNGSRLREGMAAMAVEAIVKQLTLSMFEDDSILGAAYAGRLHGKEGMAVCGSCMSVDMLKMSFTSQLETAAMRASTEKSMTSD